MSDSVPSQPSVSKRLLWRIWLFDVVIVCAIAGGTFFLAGTGDEDWGQMSSAAKCRFFVGLMVVMASTLRTNISKALAGLSKGDTTPPDPAGETQAWTRRQTDVTTQQTKIEMVTENPPKTPPAALEAKVNSPNYEPTTGVR